MWFKQIQIFELPNAKSLSADKLAENLEPLAFTSCLPSFPSSIGWISPFEDDQAPLVHAINGYIMLCLQIEEKILPATVVRQELRDKIKHIEITQDRRMRQQEKLSLKDEVTLNLLPRAFSKFTRLYAYIDPKNNWLVLNTTQAKKAEQFILLFKKSVAENIKPLELKKLSPIITHWLKSQDYPNTFSIEKACVLQDPDQQSRIIRCQQQDLFASSIQSLIKDGCEVKQLALSWQDRVRFVLAEDFTLRSIQYEEDVLAQAKEFDSETQQQQFDADFFIMTETLNVMLKDLSSAFFNVLQPEAVKEAIKEAVGM